MYGINHDLDSLPSMPVHGGTWSVMHSWALPTRSFLEFVMFSRYEGLNNLVALEVYFTYLESFLQVFLHFLTHWYKLICRMFVDALDAQMYDKHHSSGHCYLSLSKVTFYFNKILFICNNVFSIKKLYIKLPFQVCITFTLWSINNLINRSLVSEYFLFEHPWGS